jgi:hypothetical protein
VIVQLNVYKEEKEEDKKQLKIWSVRSRARAFSLLSITTRSWLTSNSQGSRIGGVPKNEPPQYVEPRR